MSKAKAIVESVEKYGDLFAIHFSDKSYVMLSGDQLADCFSDHKRKTARPEKSKRRPREKGEMGR